MERIEGTMQTIRKMVLNTDHYFELSDILIRLKNEGMGDNDIAEFAPKVMDELRDSGLVIHEEAGHNIWAYRSTLSFDPNSENSQKVTEEIKRRESIAV